MVCQNVTPTSTDDENNALSLPTAKPPECPTQSLKQKNLRPGCCGTTAVHAVDGKVCVIECSQNPVIQRAECMQMSQETDLEVVPVNLLNDTRECPDVFNVSRDLILTQKRRQAFQNRVPGLDMVVHSLVRLIHVLSASSMIGQAPQASTVDWRISARSCTT